MTNLRRLRMCSWWAPALLIGACLACTSNTADKQNLSATGRAHLAKKEYDLAIQAYTDAIATDTLDAQLYYQRGIANQMKADYQPAVRDFSSALRLDAKHALSLKNRGRTHFYLGNFPEAASDLANGLSIDSANIYVAIWLHFVRLRLGEENSEAFAQQLSRTDSTAWPTPVARYFQGTISAEQLMAAALKVESTGGSRQQCAAEFYIGEAAVARGQFGEALGHLQRTKASCPTDYSEYSGAVAELERLKQRVP